MLNLKYFPQLNALRGAAALMVLFYHFMPDADAHLPNAMVFPIKVVQNLLWQFIIKSN